MAQHLDSSILSAWNFIVFKKFNEKSWLFLFFNHLVGGHLKQQKL